MGQIGEVSLGKPESEAAQGPGYRLGPGLGLSGNVISGETPLGAMCRGRGIRERSMLRV